MDSYSDEDFSEEERKKKKDDKKERRKKKEKKKEKEKEKKKKNNKRKFVEIEDDSNNQTGGQRRMSTRKKQKTEYFSKVQNVSDNGKKKTRNRVVQPCTTPINPGQVTPQIIEWAQEFAQHRTESKGQFKWAIKMPDVPKQHHQLVRRYSRENFLPKVQMIETLDRHGKKIKCPIFPPKTIVAEVFLPKSMYDDSDYDQFKWLDKHVVEKLSTQVPGFDPETRMYNGKKYTWHHHHDEGKMQLVENGIHSATAHSGGREIWAAERTSPFDNM